MTLAEPRGDALGLAAAPFSLRNQKADRLGLGILSARTSMHSMNFIVQGEGEDPSGANHRAPSWVFLVGAESLMAHD